MRKEIIKLCGILTAITLVITLVLALANMVTKDKIAENNANKELAACAEIIDAEFTNITETLPQNEKITAVYQGIKNGKTAGYCVSVIGEGYGGDISMVVGINSDSTIAGIKIITHSETPGLGSKATTSEFRQGFEGKKSPLSVVKGGGAKDNEINAISGATRTSNGVTNAVNLASEYLKQNSLLKGDMNA